MNHYYTIELWLPIICNCLLSAIAYYFTVRLIPKVGPSFIKANLFGIDLNKTNKERIPEAIGVVIGCMFLIVMFFFIPFPFGSELLRSSSFLTIHFPYDELVKMVAALLSICCMLLLGFADDVLDLRWKYKLLLPTVASLPLLMVHYVTYNSTTIIVPKPFRFWLGTSINIGFLYYVYMGMLAVFCTNAINILAGVNGLEAGQSAVIAASIAVFNLCELSGNLWRTHQFSLYFIIPFISTTLALLKFNWFPSKVFVGDTFCYFAGMTFAVVGILGHFSKTVLLFFIPQVINFLYSVPQLFHLLPCPRHRLPRINEYGLLEASKVQFSVNEIGKLGAFVIQFCEKLGLAKVIRKDNTIIVNNFTIINLLLIYIGPMHEEHLTTVLLTLQVLCSGVAFLIRYPLASLFFDVS